MVLIPYVLIVCSYKSGAYLTIQIIIKSLHYNYVAIIKCMSSKLIHTRFNPLFKLDELKIEKFQNRTRDHWKTHETRKDCWGGNINHKSLDC